MPISSFAGILDFICEDNASQICTDWNDFGEETHGECVSELVPFLNDLCHSSAVDRVELCKWVLTCDTLCEGGLECFTCRVLQRKFDYKNLGSSFGLGPVEELLTINLLK